MKEKGYIVIMKIFRLLHTLDALRWRVEQTHTAQGAVIGAQALVNCDIPDYAIAVGVPAKVVGYRK